ncbi:MAG TPA: nucleoside deaminase [Saprospiraceae bacterium]|nr:nucleoside deaminase [Saprospiraceae bacterium]
MNHLYFLKRAIELSRQGIDKGDGGPFGAVIVKDGKILAEGHNEVLKTKDPTAHAEIVTIRKACQALNHFQLEDCILYTSCEPCPMCLGAIYWSRPKMIVFACTKKDAASIGFDDDFIYKEIELPLHERSIPMIHLEDSSAIKVMEDWSDMDKKTLY